MTLVIMTESTKAALSCGDSGLQGNRDKQKDIAYAEANHGVPRGSDIQSARH